MRRFLILAAFVAALTIGGAQAASAGTGPARIQAPAAQGIAAQVQPDGSFLIPCFARDAVGCIPVRARFVFGQPTTPSSFVRYFLGPRAQAAVALVATPLSSPLLFPPFAVYVAVDGTTGP